MGACVAVRSYDVRKADDDTTPCVASVGAGCIVTVQEAILAHWFHGRGLAIAVGLQISMSRLVRGLGQPPRARPLAHAAMTVELSGDGHGG
jgi:hypothetical protein